MRYVLMIHVDESLYGDLSQQQQDAIMADYFAFGERNSASIRGGAALHEIATATTVRVRDGKTLTTDGPFAETKEQLNGFYIVECENLDQAVELAAQIPDAVHGSVEVRPEMVFDTPNA